MEFKIKYLDDKIIKKALTNENKDIRNYIARLISHTTNIPLEELKDNLDLVYPEISSNVNIINSISDIVLKNDKKYFNIEVNLYQNRIKNLTYTFQLVLRQIKTKKYYNDIKPITQININAFDSLGFNDFVYEATLMVPKHNVIYSDLIKIYEINLSYFKNIQYNDIEKNSLLKDLALFVINDKDFLNKLYEGDKEINMLKKEIAGLTNNFDEAYYGEEALLQMKIADEKYNEGIKENAIATAKKLIKMGLGSISEIAEATSLSLNEIIKLKKDLNKE